MPSDLTPIRAPDLRERLHECIHECVHSGRRFMVALDSRHEAVLVSRADLEALVAAARPGESPGLSAELHRLRTIFADPDGREPV